MKMVVLAAAVSSSIAMAEPVNLYRMYSGNATDHLYVTSVDELAFASSVGYTYEGVSGRCLSTQEPGTVPLHRMWGGGTLGDHFYTASWQERDIAAARGEYTYEGVSCYVYPQQQPGSCPFYRLFAGTNHFYTLSWLEAVNAVRSYHYNYEGVAAYLLPASGACPN